MKRYFIIKEFFGIRVYDSIKKTERYYNAKEFESIRNMYQDNYIEIDNAENEGLSSPLKISMNLTKKCNLRCKQCFSDSGEILEPEISTKEMYKLFDDMNKYGTFFICIGGGEPLTRKDLLNILEYGKKKQLAISIVSNGLLLTKDLINKLNQMNLDTFWISLDGLKENHEYLRGIGKFNKAIDAIKLLRKEFNSKIAIRVSLSKYNISEYKKIIELAEKLDVDILRFTPILSFGRAKSENLVISQEQYISFLKEIKTISSKVQIIHPAMTNLSKFWVDPKDFGCHCGKEAIWIDELGNYSPCIFFGNKYNIGNIKEDDYIKLWNRCKEVANYNGNEVCKNCTNYKNCRGGCRARVLFEYGQWDDVDPLCPLGKNKR